MPDVDAVVVGAGPAGAAAAPALARARRPGGLVERGPLPRAQKMYGGRVVGVRTDRPGGELAAKVVIACDGVNSFVAKEAGLYGSPDPANFTVGVKETLALPKDVIDERFGVRDREGVDIEILGGTAG